MAAGRGIPHADPYSYTAHGVRWVVESWLAELSYGWAHRIGGLHLVVLEQAVLMALLAGLMATLARAGTPLRTALAAGVAVGAGVAWWTPRPLLFGLVGMALTVLVVERRASPWWLVPIVWVWANTHGSFALGLLWLLARLVGLWLDRDDASPRYVLGFAGGLVAALVNPFGPRLLTFAATLGQKRAVFRGIVEWHSPNFQNGDGLFTLVFLGAALVILLRTRVPWRDLLPVVGFVALGLLALRNLPVAAIVIAPALGRSLQPEQESSRGRPRLNWAFVAVIAGAMVLFAAASQSHQALDLGSYPVAATRYLDREGLLRAPHRLAHQDIVGDYLILYYYRRGARVFVDDRYDMYPARVSDDYTDLLRVRSDPEQVLDRYRVDVVLWADGQPLVTVLLHEGWHRAFARSGWVVLTRQSGPREARSGG